MIAHRPYSCPCLGISSACTPDIGYDAPCPLRNSRFPLDIYNLQNKFQQRKYKIYICILYVTYYVYRNMYKKYILLSHPVFPVPKFVLFLRKTHICYVSTNYKSNNGVTRVRSGDVGDISTPKTFFFMLNILSTIYIHYNISPPKIRS